MTTLVTAGMDRLAATLVLAESTNPSSLAALHTAICELADAAGEPRIEAICRSASSLVEKIILEEVDDLGHAWETVKETILLLQEALRDGRDIDEMPWPCKIWRPADASVYRPLDTNDIHMVGLPELEVVPASSVKAYDEPVADNPMEGKPHDGRPTDSDPELLTEFVAETGEHLRASNVHLLTIVTNPEDAEAVNAVFRAFHTIKGVAGFLGLDEIASLAHETEGLLDRSRKNEMRLEGAAVDIIFDSVDMVKRLADDVSRSSARGESPRPHDEVPELIRRLRTIASDAGDARRERQDEAKGRSRMRLGEILVQNGVATRETIDEALAIQAREVVRHPLGSILVKQGKVTQEQVLTAVRQQEAGRNAKLGEILISDGLANESDIAQALKDQKATAQHPPLGQVLVKGELAPAKGVARALRMQRILQEGSAQAAEPVRVSAARLDRLVDTIEELVIAESLLRQSALGQQDLTGDIVQHLRQLETITRELREMGTSLRMAPIRSTFQKMARLVRDLSRKSGKAVVFSTEGDDTELDRSALDKIGDPLVHMIRNAIDHGIEDDARRRTAAGKPAAGRVALRAFHKDGGIHIEVEDDGRGIDSQAILAKAQERGIVRKNDNLDEREIFNLIFLPGFSTASTVTDVSGRGVGMDVVRRNIESLHGRVEIQSRPGRGSLFSIRLPLTPAVGVTRGQAGAARKPEGLSDSSVAPVEPEMDAKGSGS